MNFLVNYTPHVAKVTMFICKKEVVQYRLQSRRQCYLLFLMTWEYSETNIIKNTHVCNWLQLLHGNVKIANLIHICCFTHVQFWTTYHFIGRILDSVWSTVCVYEVTLLKKRGLCLVKSFSKKLQNLPYFMNTKTCRHRPGPGIHWGKI